MSQIPDEADERLWVEVEGRDGRRLLGYNPHTFLGRIAAWGVADHEWLYVSKSDVLAASELAEAWIDGFLCGNEPEPEEMFGDRIHAFDDETDWRWRRWRESLQTFRETGVWDGRPWFALSPFADDAELPDSVWTVRGEEVWCWRTPQWEPAAPQPAMIEGEFLVGTSCADRREHGDEVFVDDHHAVCAECGRAKEYRVDGEDCVQA